MFPAIESCRAGQTAMEPMVFADNVRSAGLAWRQLKIVHVVLSMDVGGLEQVVLDLVREGRLAGHHVTVLCVERPGVLAEQAEMAGADLLCLHKGPGVRWGTGQRARMVLEKLRPDVVHTHQIGALFYVGSAAKKSGVPVVVHTEHGKHFPGRFRTRCLSRWAVRSADRFFCVSKDIANGIERWRIAPKDKVRVVANGIDLDRFQNQVASQKLRGSLGIPAEAPVIGTIGRLTEIKRQDLLIRAFLRLRNTFPAAHLLLVGDGNLRRELESLAAQLNLTNAVHFAGYQSKPELYLGAMNVFALTSRSEGMPLVVLEAWAAGVPIIASRVGGLPEMIDEGKTGLLFESGDEDALARGLGRLLSEADLTRQLVDNGTRRVETEFSARRMVEAYQRHYCEALESKKAPA